MNAERKPLPEKNTPAMLRTFADALDKDRGHRKSYVTLLMREAAAEIAQMRRTYEFDVNIPLAELREMNEMLAVLARDLIAYSGLREKVRTREDESEYQEAERLIRHFDALTDGRYGSLSDARV